MNSDHEQPSVRRIVLPSGRSIEVVRFGESNHATPGLHVCPDCGSELVQPVDWSEAPDDAWNLVLNCPNCDWYTEGVYRADQVRELEDRLDEGLADMLRDLQRLTQANMADQIDRFVTALHADQILPEDF
jgi:predicted RNA-binding Zn-ribbon protein involved in translation (DUF1610 family)